MVEITLLRMKNLKFLLDADDVLLKTGDEKIRWLRGNLTEDDVVDKSRTLESILPYDCSRTALVPIIGHENYERMTVYVYSADGTTSTKPLDGALDSIKELAEMGRIYVVSARKPEQIQNTRNWLQANGFDPYIERAFSEKEPECIDIPVISGSKKVGIAKHLGAQMLVDDDERHMPKEPVEGVDCLLFGPGDREKIIASSHHVIIAPNWNDVVRYTRKYATGTNQII